LDYGHGGYGDKPRGPVSGQVTMGFSLWIFAVLLFGTLIRGSTFQDYAKQIAALELSAVAGLSLWLRIKYGWRGFIPGVLLGFGLTCLVPIGIVAVVCGGWKP
jgi:hypothetical protein